MQMPGASVLAPTPRKMGANTTWKVDFTMPMASIGTTAPSTNLQISGVMKMQPNVVEVVIKTLRATSPPAMSVHRLDAWPPLMEPTSTMPAKIAPDAPIALAIKKANTGMIA